MNIPLLPEEGGPKGGVVIMPERYGVTDHPVRSIFERDLFLRSRPLRL